MRMLPLAQGLLVKHWLTANCVARAMDHNRGNVRFSGSCDGSDSGFKPSVGLRDIVIRCSVCGMDDRCSPASDWPGF